MFNIPLFQNAYDWITIVVGLTVTVIFYHRYFNVYKSQQLLNSLPGIWTSLGLLFTFVAICSSMQELQNTPSIESIEGEVLKKVGSTSINITKIIGADICVIDFPLLDTRSKSQNLIGRFISDIVLQVLSFVAQNERENIKKRQAEGIRIAKEKGVRMGRPKCKLPNNFKDIAVSYYEHKITNKEASKMLKINRGTFLKYAKEYEPKNIS